MSNLNISAVKSRTFDAIVIGSGISGGWAAKELTGKGLKTLVLERGREVKHVVRLSHGPIASLGAPPSRPTQSRSSRSQPRCEQMLRLW